MEFVALVFLVIGIVLCHKLSASYNQRIKEKYCEGCINWWWSVVIAILLSAAFLTIGEDAFWLFLLLTVGSAGLSAWLTYRKMLAWGATSKEAGMGSIAQVASSVGIAAAITFAVFLIFGDSGKKRKRK